MKSIVYATSAVALASGSALATVTATLTDQASVEATLVAPIVEDFNDETPGNLDQTLPAAFNGFTVTANGASGFASDFSIGDDGGGNLFLNAFAETGLIESFTFTFDAPIDTFAAQFTSPASADGIVLTFSTGEVIDVASIAGVDGFGTNYISFVNDTLFTSVTLSSTFEAVQIDNVVTGVIPAPGAVGLLGMAGLAAVRRRR